MDRIIVGLFGAPFREPRKYGRELNGVELQETFEGHPRPSTLDGWKKAVPENFHFVVKCHRTVTHPSPQRELAGMTGLFRDTPQVQQAWKGTLDTARRLGAKVVLVETPSQFTPARSNVDNMLRLLADGAAARPDGLSVVWKARGPWSPEEMQELGERAGIVPCIDPLRDPVPPGRVAYGHLYHYFGTRQSFGLDTSLDAANNLMSAGAEQGYLFFGNPRGFQDAGNLKRALDEGALDADEGEEEAWDEGEWDQDGDGGDEE